MLSSQSSVPYFIFSIGFSLFLYYRVNSVVVYIGFWRQGGRTGNCTLTAASVCWARTIYDEIERDIV